MLLLIDIGNTNTHLGVANDRRVVRQADVPTGSWGSPEAGARLRHLVGAKPLEGVALCSVVPRCTPVVLERVTRLGPLSVLELTPATLRGLGIEYPKPKTIGPDRLANALAAKHHFGAPVVVVDFGTAVTFDVVNRQGSYVGGIIAPGMAVMTEYLHEKTALLPQIRIRDTSRVIGKSTAEAMLVGAVHGYRGLVRELIKELKRELDAPRLPVVATGGYGKLIAAGLPEINAVDPLLTLEGLRIAWERQRAEARGDVRHLRRGGRTCHLKPER